MQEEEEVGPALPNKSDFVYGDKVKSVEEVQHPPHEDEQDIKLDTNSDLRALFQDSVERGITGSGLVPAEVTVMFLG